jgi:aryl-alcohol dehydrogenase-like predicted oxidoreductase
MEYRYLGKSGIKVSPLCLGSMQFGWTADEASSYLVLNGAHDAGINFIDTADVYSRWAKDNPGGVSERIIGQWLHQANIPRDQIVLATKVRGRTGEGPNDEGLSRAHILAAVEGSLRRLQTDYIDVYQAHFFDENVSIEETLAAFDHLIRQGKVRYIGCSNYPAWRLMQALWVSDKLELARYASLQPHYNLIHRPEFEVELADICRTYGLGVIPYSPLAGGFLTGKYHKDTPDAGSQRNVSRHFSDKNWATLQEIEKIGQESGWSVSQISLAWLLNQPVITSPIIGPRNPDQLADNLGALDVKLSKEQVSHLDLISG